VLSQIARLLKRPELRAELLAAAEPRSLAEAIRRTAAAEGL
jgi:mannitol/fructose-specific phosphotransferase system IIA component (Ntr-type)